MSQSQLELYNPQRREQVDNCFCIHHVGHVKWEIISKTNINDKNIWKLLYDIGKSNSRMDTSKNLNYSGDSLYHHIRDRIYEKDFLLTKNVAYIQDNLNIKQNKAAIIRNKNLEKMFNDEINKLLTNFTDDIYKPQQESYFNLKFEESVIVKIIMQCKFILERYNSLNKSSKPKKSKITQLKNQIIEMIIGFNKIVKEKRQNNFISHLLLDDLESWIEKIKTSINFSDENIIVEHPNLIFKTSYDKLLAIKNINLYPSQKEIFEFVTSTDSYLALVHTMLGSGKTTMILPLCGWLMDNRKTFPDTKFIFCCPNEIVLLEVANMIFGMALPFAIVVYNIKDPNDKVLEYKWSTFVNQKCPEKHAILYICDIFVTRMLLEKRAMEMESRELYFEANKRDPKNYPLLKDRIPYVEDYILIGDELTKDADIQKGFMTNCSFSINTELFIDIMKIAPPKIILMSSTLPTYYQLPELYDAILNNNPNMIIKSFVASEAKIGCALIDSNGSLYAPHLYSKTVDEIKCILEVIKTNPFIGRFYTFEIVLAMIKQFSYYKLETPDLQFIKNDPSKASQGTIQSIAYKLLTTLISINSNELIEKICEKISEPNPVNIINLDTIFTKNIKSFNKGCLIFHHDPVKLALDIYCKNFNEFFDSDIEKDDDTEKDKDIFAQVKMDNILRKYNLKKKVTDKVISKLDNKTNTKSNNKSAENIESWKKISNLSESKSSWDFPSELQLFSPDHLNKIKCTDILSPVKLITPEHLPVKSIVSLNILTMLASGIGIYSTTDSRLDDIYLNQVISLAKQGFLPIIFTDHSMAYGTNLSVSDIILIDDYDENKVSIVDNHSIKTLFQMLGRAGRGGNLSYQAKIYTTSKDHVFINKLRAYIRNELDEGTKDEIKNIRNAYNVMW